MSEDAQQHEPILNFQRMYCTVYLCLQAELSDIHTEKRSEEALFHLPHKHTSKDCRKGPTKLPKEAPKPSSGCPEDTSKRSPNPVLFQNHFLRWSLPGGGVVSVPLGPGQGTPITYRYIYIYTLKSSRAKSARLIL